MLICICKGVSDRKVVDEIRRGSRTVKDLRQGCGAGSDCGCCVRKLSEMIREHSLPQAAHKEG